MARNVDQHSTVSQTGNGAENEEDEQQNLWSSILSEVSSHTSSKLPTCKTVIVLGEDESGKTTLISRLQGVEDPKKGFGLEYLYLDVRDEDRDDSTRCGVWILGGEDDYQDLLRYALTAESLEHAFIIIVVDMSQPWNIIDSLEKYTKVLRRHIDSLRIPPQKLKELEQRLVQQFQEYTEPEEGEQESSRKTSIAAQGDEEQVVLPLGETTHTKFAVPIAVVVSKSDSVSALEKDNDYREEHLDFMQQHIRKFCLNYGASLFYVSVKESKNCDLLYKYMIHRIYSFPFSMPALVVEKDAIFIPSGWDSLQKISILYENMPNLSPDKSFDEVIMKPIVRKTLQENKEVVAEDEQTFLLKQQGVLSKQLPQEARNRWGQRSFSCAVAKVWNNLSQSGEAGPAAGTNEGVLANFFNSLLSKKTAGSPGKPTGSVRSDAVAELDRMTKGRKPVPGQSATSPSSNSTS
ncbi:putative cytoplasmic dynein 1 light intermediate chain 2 isoform X3 [Apostichopus japonicus]|uniref:Dynein light intermediate chain n=1 Tax=Stichopus japonicus TaxID=307972 RepID=A0A2G8K6D6_STIJA|nr:putative cytoplasmic dynein 1 light intermediate chain 2 isoform X3 [Apostichopus japonicus]